MLRGFAECWHKVGTQETPAMFIPQGTRVPGITLGTWNEQHRQNHCLVETNNKHKPSKSHAECHKCSEKKNLRWGGARMP